MTHNADAGTRPLGRPRSKRIQEDATSIDDHVIAGDELSAAVHDAAEELQDAPVQTFVPLLAENKARAELHDRKEHQERSNRPAFRAIAVITWPQCG